MFLKVIHVDTHHFQREEDQSHYTLETVERVKAGKRAGPERDLLCAPWRGRAVANSPTLRLDESTVKAGSQKSKRWAEGVMSNVRQGGETKESVSAKLEVKIKKA